MTKLRELTAAQRDLVMLLSGALAFTFLSIQLEVFEHVHAWTRPHELYQVDELPGVLLFLACGLAWYAWRRVGEVRTELALRRSVEDRLRAALAENRDLALAAVRVQEDERRSLARELHDELGQWLNAVKIDAVCLRDGSSGYAGNAGDTAAPIVAAVDHMQSVVRDIVRRLRPAGLDELGLPAAIEHCVEGWQRRLPTVAFRLTIDRDLGKFDEAINITIYRLLQEGLTNVARHAQAALVEITLTRRPLATAERAEVVLAVRDDGIGPPDTATRGVGLIGMRERVEALAGCFEVGTAGSRGFSFEARIPLQRMEAA